LEVLFVRPKELHNIESFSIFVWKPRQGGRLQSDKAEDTAAGLQPPNGPTPFSRKTWYSDDAEGNRSKMRSAILKMAMAKLLAFGHAGGPGSHPTPLDVMAKPTIFLSFLNVFEEVLSSCCQYTVLLQQLRMSWCFHLY